MNYSLRGVCRFCAAISDTRRALVALLCFGALAMPAFADVGLSVGSVAGSRGAEIVVPITVDVNAEAASTFDFDLLFDNSRLHLLNVTAGPAALAVGKGVGFFVTSTKVGIVIWGGNIAVGDGVVALAHFIIREQAEPGEVLPLTVSNASAADTTVPFPNTINVVATNGEVTVTEVLVPATDLTSLILLGALLAIGSLPLLRRYART